MSEIDKNEEKMLDTSNIFDEFEVDDEIREEIEKIAINKDSSYYFKKSATVLKYINFLLIFVILITSSYIYLQKSESDLFNNKDYLKPICWVLNWYDINLLNQCSSITISNNNMDDKISNLNKTNLKKVVWILEKSYEIDSIKNSKEAIFIIDKSRNKNDPVFILNEFDKVKNDFTGTDKTQISCTNIVISWNILDAKCKSFSTAWYSNIPWFKWNNTSNIEWTSITIASSFINFISKSDNFNVIDRQKIFDNVPYFWEWNFIYETDFNLKIEYNDNILTI